MKTLIKFEEAALFGFCIYLFDRMDFQWWIFPLLILLPDLSMAGYFINKDIGAWIYNAFHFRGMGLALYLAGLYTDISPLALTGLILFSHSTLDRAFGYGLKLRSGFRHTHLGEIC
ncbi:MAG: DUF4260 domain-containing protein [Spirochaetia bacterium]|nr:DUF4260 domain-containing protein [Spirochaetia bacterium]